MSKLDAASIQAPLTELARSRLEKLEVFSSIASTNTYLMSQPPPAIRRYRVAVADHQTSGRGRHFRRWISAPGAGLYLSFAYTFAAAARDLGGLTLAIGVGVISALQQLGIDGVALKWPNDVVARGGKLGGILTEVQSAVSANATVVTGVGLNLDLPERPDVSFDSEWAQRPVDLKSIVEQVPDRDTIAGNLVEHLYLAFLRFDDLGLAGFLDDWRQHDWLRGRAITVDQADAPLSGTAAGVGDDGSLLVDTPQGRIRVISGSIILAGAEAATE